MKAIHIVLNNDSDSIVGSAGWDGYDAGASISNLKQRIADRVAREYPGFHVTVDDDLLIDTRISIDDGTDNDPANDEEYIRDLISSEWQDWDAWAVEAEPAA